MESAVKILYDGRKFESFQKTTRPDFDKLLIQGMAYDIEAALAILAPEIEKEGGEVTVNVKGPTMFEISTDGLSDKLKNKVLEVLKPAN
jgi:hypothetical protein